MRAVFFGTPAIAVPALEALAAVMTVTGVVCQPDKPSGRGLGLHAPPVKERAIALGLEVVQPAKVRTPDFAEWVRSRDADVGVVLAYGRILPPAVLAAPRRGCMNFHGSLLPRWRGAAPITWAVVRGDRTTGVTLMQMDEGCDTGPVLATREVSIGPDETAGDLGLRLGALAAEMVRDELRRAVAGELRAEPQDGALATAAPMLSKEDGRIDWTRPAGELHDHVRGMTPWPGAFTVAHGKVLKVLRARVWPLPPGAGDRSAAGTVLRADKAGAVVACGRDALEILRGQVEGRRALDAGELVSGRAIAAGAVLG